MNTISNQPIKIGKVSRAVEQSFRVTFASDVVIYARQEFISELIEKRGDNYLKTLEEIKDILLRPDIVYYAKEERTFVYFRLYPSRMGFQVIGVHIIPIGHPKRFCVDSMKRYSNEECIEMTKSGAFRRLVPIKKGRKPAKST